VALPKPEQTAEKLNNLFRIAESIACRRDTGLLCHENGDAMLFDDAERIFVGGIISDVYW
jgi:hypothetical protein